ncbi:heme exporter protein CcmD [Halomonas icarae]|uniref:Heme exporter protein D n=1 Tax=Halomonas icarae TaxID=2691040 RepID=A0A7X5AMF3_9GAMM|nr:heme exporter protein CcmD [Halomonas icarae]MDR5900761.1 heme exporter protein CcmD [Halomonas icarae]NAW13771.1 heme exporter protein CcmD [Halomonas icarae]
MAFDSFQDFLAMGGHAPYVWASWGVTGALLIGIVLHARAERRRLLRLLQRRRRRQAATNQTSHRTGGERHEA